MPRVVLVGTSKEDRLVVNGKDLGRIDHLSNSQILCLLAREGVIQFQIKTE
jgi:hypothetical protein